MVPLLPSQKQQQQLQQQKGEHFHEWTLPLFDYHFQDAKKQEVGVSQNVCVSEWVCVCCLSKIWECVCVCVFETERKMWKRECRKNSWKFWDRKVNDLREEHRKEEKVIENVFDLKSERETEREKK